MATFKTGCLPGVRPAALKDLSVYATGLLPSPPPTLEVTKGVYPIDCNDRIGDCTMAAAAHLLEAWSTQTGRTEPIPSEAEIEAEYFKLTGGEDTGLVEANVLKTWHTEGLFGDKIAGYAPVNPKDLLQLHQSVAFYGGCYLGIQCGTSQQEQFQRGEEWTYTGREEEDGHCVVALGYGPNGGLHCATWGGIAVLSAGFLAHKLNEAWVILSQQMVEARRDALGIDIEGLQSDLTKV